MVRRCCVENCPETDTTILSHRFPKTEIIAQKWQEALGVTKISLQELQKGSWVVCCRHFKKSDYRNAATNSLNTPAIPNLGDNSSNERIFASRAKIKGEKGARDHKTVESQNKETATSSPIIFKENANKRPSTSLKDLIITKRQKLKSPGIKIESVIKLNEEPTTIDDLSFVVESVEGETYEEHVETSQNTSTMTDIISTKNQEVQVKIIDPETPAKSSDKDEKIIALLYPEFASKSKVDLIKMIKEKDLKIASLEEKEKQLENVLKSML